MCQSNIQKQWLGNKWLYSFIPQGQWLWKRQRTGYLKYRFRGLPLSGSSRKPHQSLGRNHIHYSFPYTEFGTHNPHLWAPARLSLCVHVLGYSDIWAHKHVCELVCVQLWACDFLCMQMCMLVTTCWYAHGLCTYAGAWGRRQVAFVATWYSWGRLLQCAAVREIPVEPHGHTACLGHREHQDQLNTKHLHTGHSAAPMLTSQHCFTHSWTNLVRNGQNANESYWCNIFKIIY